MEFEWDAQKSNACYAQRGFDFRFAANVFFDPCRITMQDVRENYGESRYVTFGHIEGRLFCVVYTLRGETIRIISARKANSREVKKYGYRQR